LNGCEYCYARKLANTRLKERYLANKSHFGLLDKDYYGADPFYPRFWEDRLRELDPTWRVRHYTVGGGSKVQPKGIFVCDMSDLFGIGIPEKWTRRVLDIIKTNYQHRFYLLTKQPQNLPQWSPFPDNCWVGVSAEGGDQFKHSYFEASHQLSMIEAKVKFISLEPLLGAVDKIAYQSVVSDEYINFTHNINLLIIGACTGQRKELLELRGRYPDLQLIGNTLQPRIEWVAEIVEACDKAGVKVFLKNNLKPLLPPEVPTFYSLRLTTVHEDGEPEYEPVLRQEIPV
ncbi:hypothetical protein LCGC14_2454740, partial [marine sediment metagenome]